MKRYAKILIFLVLFSGCAAPVVRFETIKPAEINVQGIKKIAIGEFTGPGDSGEQAAYRLSEILLESGRYTVLEREKIKSILKEQGLSLSGIVDQSSAAQIGKLLGVDALIFGNVTDYNCEDETGTRKVEKKVGTGRYRTVTRKNILTGKTFTVREEIKKTVLVDQHYHIRRGTVTINFKMVKVETGELLCVKSITKTFQKEVIEGKGYLPSKDEILSKLTDEAVREFAGMIAPIKVVLTRKLEKGSGRVNTGVKFAQKGLWNRAVKIWSAEVSTNPTPEAYYDLGVGYEALGRFQDAEKMYNKAVDMNPKDMYIEALKRVKKILNQ